MIKIVERKLLEPTRDNGESTVKWEKVDEKEGGSRTID